MKTKPRDLTAIRMGGDLVEELKLVSEVPGTFYSERSVNWLISQAVKEFIDKRKAISKAMEQAAAEVKKDADPAQGF
jgi:hypothetical protein